MIQLEREHYTIVGEILAKYPYQFYVYGSRSKGAAKPLSDLDLCCKENIPLNILAHINEDFENSRLPFKVEVVIWDKLTKDFQELITKDLKPFILQEERNKGVSM
ncbi:MAG TPA: nucleotidyltransferase domain-containing protein [Gammaproteobacteria bacterium]|nr:nucleotidyltransferase domain-containing protein [Gammaproteobacteria bacterium]